MGGGFWVVKNKKRRRPTLPQSSTIGAAGLNVRVRDGNGWGPCAIATSIKRVESISDDSLT